MTMVQFTVEEENLICMYHKFRGVSTLEPT